MKSVPNFLPLVGAFFTSYLMQQRGASPHTIASYRDTFRLLASFAGKERKLQPSKLQVESLDAPLILAFLDDLEKGRGNSPRTRNCRLAAIHSFFAFVAREEPMLGAVAQRVLAIQGKRCAKHTIDYLTRPEMEALLAVPDGTTWSGCRDRTILTLALETGLRVSELVALKCQDLAFGTGAHVKFMGKGRKTRCVPLRKETAAAIRKWMTVRKGCDTDVLFPNARGKPLTRDGVEYLLSKHARTARKTCATLENKRVSPHVLRHSTAMSMLEGGVDCSVIALWLGHEALETTHAYLHASLELKEKALASTTPMGKPTSRYRPPDPLLAFLESL